MFAKSPLQDDWLWEINSQVVSFFRFVHINFKYCACREQRVPWRSVCLCDMLEIRRNCNCLSWHINICDMIWKGGQVPIYAIGRRKKFETYHVSMQSMCEKITLIKRWLWNAFVNHARFFKNYFNSSLLLRWF